MSEEYQNGAYTFVFLFNDTATTEIYTLSLHDALPICERDAGPRPLRLLGDEAGQHFTCDVRRRSEEHTSELQSRQYLVCRLLLEKKKNTTTIARYDLFLSLLPLWFMNLPLCRPQFSTH